MEKQKAYEIIKNKIQALKTTYANLRTETDAHVFTVLCVKSSYFKNPSLLFTENEINNILVDSTRDGGVDAILSDPNSETSNLVLCQSKYQEKITFDEVREAISKLILFYKDMVRGNYEIVNSKVQRRFITLNSEVGDESKVQFVLYTSGDKNRIREDRINKLLLEYKLDPNKYEIVLYFAEDIVEEIKEAESRRETVELGKIIIDKANNVLYYDNDEAAIVNASAFSIKELYAEHGTNLLSKNLRYFIKKRDIDSSIMSTINNDPSAFWFKNNGITIICEEFRVSGTIVKIENFSIVNGGQTTTLLHKSKAINKDNDLYLPCKIIKIQGKTEDEKNLFSLEIAKATNSQKAIKQIDLKSNAPEQVRFAREMRNIGIFYQTKRGEEIPKDYREEYKNTDLAEIGKLCLAGIFQLPGSSRSKPSILYQEKYYNPIFNEDQIKVAALAKELLYIDNYFKKTFLTKFDKEKAGSPRASEIIPFANNARTICIAFVVLASRYFNKNIKQDHLTLIFDHLNKEQAYDEYCYDIFKNIDSMTSVLPKKLFEDKDGYDKILFKLFETIIIEGQRYYSVKKEYDNTLNETNFLKKDNNYYAILKNAWDSIEKQINLIFESIGE